MKVMIHIGKVFRRIPRGDLKIHEAWQKLKEFGAENLFVLDSKNSFNQSFELLRFQSCPRSPRQVFDPPPTITLFWGLKNPENFFPREPVLNEAAL